MTTSRSVAGDIRLAAELTLAGIAGSVIGGNGARWGSKLRLDLVAVQHRSTATHGTVTALARPAEPRDLLT